LERAHVLREAASYRVDGASGYACCGSPTNVWCTAIESSTSCTCPWPRQTDELGRLRERLRRCAVLVIDELGFVPFDKDGGELLFDVLSARHEKRATIITSNLAFSEWHRVFGDE
jgi:hypothetical protein